VIVAFGGRPQQVTHQLTNCEAYVTQLNARPIQFFHAE
jgi:hypothetical protein